MLLSIILGLAAVLALTATWQKSVTIDEFAYLPNGVALLEAHAFQMDVGTTPLPKMLLALPVVLLGNPRVDLTALRGQTDVWVYANQFLDANRSAYHTHVILARAVSILVLLATCLVVFASARSFYGPAGGLLALICAAFEPNLLAHGQLATTDIYLAATMTLSVWRFDLFLRHPDARRAGLLGVAVGAASLCKFTGVLLVPLLIVAALCIVALRFMRIGEDDPQLVLRRRTIGWGIVAALAALLTINAGYLFEGTFSRLDRYAFETAPFRYLQQSLPLWVRLPFPYYFLSGMDLQFAQGGDDAYLLGHFNTTGFWYYYIVGFLVKTPVVLPLLGAAAFFCKPRVLLREIPMLVVGLALFVFISLAGHKNIGIRYLLFVVPLGCIWIGRLTVSPMWGSPGHGLRMARVTGLAVGSVIVSALSIWPHYLAYFNLLSGGPPWGHTYLLDSNLDWGQDLIALRRYMEAEHIESVDLAYFGRVPPEMYGIRYRTLIGKPKGQYVVISATLLWGRRYYVTGSAFVPRGHDHYQAFRGLKPKAVIGYTLYVFDMAGQ